jgi:hypothetical protein
MMSINLRRRLLLLAIAAVAFQGGQASEGGSAVCKASCDNQCAAAICEEVALAVKADAEAATNEAELQAVWDAASFSNTYKVSQFHAHAYRYYS